jgi:hypothetical protein
LVNPDEYGVRAADPPAYLVPARLLAELHAAPGLVRAAGVRVERLDGPPDGALPPPLSHGDLTVWVTDPATGATWPYEFTEELLAAIDGAVAGQPLLQLPPSRSEHTLIVAKVLVSAGAADGMPTGLHEAYDAAGFARLRNLIPPLHVGELRRWYRRLARQGRLRYGDAQVGRRYAAYDDEIAGLLHRQLAAAVSRAVGRTVHPSYSYLAGYRDGAALPEHRDRRQCQHTLSVLLDYSPEPERQSPWPIELRLPERRTMIYQSIGDGLLFRGDEIPHSRRPLPPGHSSTSLLLHYVDETRAGSPD